MRPVPGGCLSSWCCCTRRLPIDWIGRCSPLTITNGASIGWPIAGRDGARPASGIVDEAISTPTTSIFSAAARCSSCSARRGRVWARMCWPNGSCAGRCGHDSPAARGCRGAASQRRSPREDCPAAGRGARGSRSEPAHRLVAGTGPTGERLGSESARCCLAFLSLAALTVAATTDVGVAPFLLTLIIDGVVSVSYGRKTRRLARTADEAASGLAILSQVLAIIEREKFPIDSADGNSPPPRNQGVAPFAADRPLAAADRLPQQQPAEPVLRADRLRVAAPRPSGPRHRNLAGAGRTAHSRLAARRRRVRGAGLPVGLCLRAPRISLSENPGERAPVSTAARSAIRSFRPANACRNDSAARRRNAARLDQRIEHVGQKHDAADRRHEPRARPGRAPGPCRNRSRSRSCRSERRCGFAIRCKAANRCFTPPSAG